MGGCQVLCFHSYWPALTKSFRVASAALGRTRTFQIIRAGEAKVPIHTHLAKANTWSEINGIHSPQKGIALPSTRPIVYCVSRPQYKPVSYHNKQNFPFKESKERFAGEPSEDTSQQ